MFPISAIQSGIKDRRTAILIGLVITVLSVPMIIYAFGANPPLGYTGAPGQGTCASCHGTLTVGSGVTVNAPASYTAGGAAVSMTVTIPATGGFELAILAQSNGSQAGTLAAGPTPAGAAFPQDAQTTVGTLQYVYSTVETTSWSFLWTPPAVSAGNVVLYVSGGTHNTNYFNSYVITGPPPPPPLTLGVSPTSLTFTVNGAEPADQTISVTSGGSPVAVTASSATTPAGGTWLTIMPPGGNTPLTETVHIVATGLAAGTYNGSVSFTSFGASNSPLSVPVTLNVTTPIPTAGPPTLNLSSTGLTFTATVGGTAPPAQNVSVTASDGSAVTFTDSAATTSGGNWLSVTPATGTTPGTEAISVAPPSTAAGTYHGTVTFTSSAVANSPVTLPVTLTLSLQSPVPSLQFSFVVVDRQSHGTEWILLDGTGSVNSSDQATGGGSFTRFRTRASGEGESTTSYVVATGTWTATSFTSFTPVTGSSNGGTLVLQVQISTKGGSTTTGSMTISSTGTNTGVNLDIEEDSENHKDLHFVNVGINNTVSITKDELIKKDE